MSMGANDITFACCLTNSGRAELNDVENRNDNSHQIKLTISDENNNTIVLTNKAVVELAILLRRVTVK